jgi:hypothetical protein
MLNDQRVEAIFEEMDKLIIELEADPSCLGPQYFQDMIATCRNYLNRVGLVLNELDRERLIVSSELRRLEASYELEHDELLANDQSIKDLGSSIEDRKAAVGWRLREQRSALHECRSRLRNLDAVHKVVAYRNKELHATMTAIRDQKRLMTAELRSGSFYGDERASSLPGSDDGLGVTADELATLMDESETSESESLASSNSVEGYESNASDVEKSDAAVPETEATLHDLEAFLQDD